METEVTENDQALAHYGVLGMKWGVRRAAKSAVSKLSKARKKNSAKYLSDDELRKRIKRMELENQYNALRKKGSSNTKKILSKIGKTALNDVVTPTATSIGKEVLRNVAGEAINAKAGRRLVNVSNKKKK